MAKFQGIKGALRHAIQSQDFDAVSTYLKKGNLVNEPLNDQNQTALHYAVIEGSKKMIYKILMHGGDWSKIDKRGYTVLHIAICRCRSEDTIIDNLEIFLNLGVPDIVTPECGKTALCLAFEYRLIKVADFLINQEANIYERDVNEYRLLSMLIEQYEVPECFSNKVSNSYALFAKILSKRSSVDCKFNGDKKVIQLAVERGLDDMALSMLFRRTRDVDFLSNCNSNILHILIKTSEKDDDIFDDVQDMIRKGVSVDAFDKNGDTPLHLAIQNSKNLKMIEMMLQHSKDINHCNKKGMSKLHVMIDQHKNFCENMEMYLNVIRLLVSKGSNVNKKVKSWWGWTPGHFAIVRFEITHKLLEFLRIIQKNGGNFRLLANRGESMLHLFSHTRSDVHDENLERSIVDLLIEGGCKFNAPDENGWTPLHNAVQQNRTNVVQNLLKRGAKVQNLTKDTGETPLHCATEYYGESGQDLVVELLVKYGVDLNATNKDGKTVLHKAANIFSVKLVEPLCSLGADVNCRDEFLQRTPLHLAIQHEICVDDERMSLKVENERKNVIESLLKHGADVNAKMKGGLTPLHLVQGKSIGVTSMLIDSSAEVDAHDDEGLLPLHYALEQAGYKNVRCLLYAGADINDVSFALCAPFAKFVAERSRKVPRFGSYIDVGFVVWKQLVKLKDAGLPVSAVYERYTNGFGLEIFVRDSTSNYGMYETVARSFRHYEQNNREKRRAEIEKMKKYVITDSMSLYDVLHLHPARRFVYTENEKFKDWMSESSKMFLFPHYCGIIRASFKEAIKRKSLLKSATTALNRLSGMFLPDLCTERILYYCKNENLRMLSLAVN